MAFTALAAAEGGCKGVEDGRQMAGARQGRAHRSERTLHTQYGQTIMCQQCPSDLHQDDSYTYNLP